MALAIFDGREKASVQTTGPSDTVSGRQRAAMHTERGLRSAPCGHIVCVYMYTAWKRIHMLPKIYYTETVVWEEQTRDVCTCVYVF